MTDKAKILFRLRHAIDRVANNPGDEWFSGAHEDLIGWIGEDLDAFAARVRAEVAEEIAGELERRSVYAGLATADTYANAAMIARTFAAGSSPDTTPEGT